MQKHYNQFDQIITENDNYDNNYNFNDRIQ